MLNISSVEGIRAGLTRSPVAAYSYSASKAAVLHLTKALSRSFAEHDMRITVNCICPGVFPSNMSKVLMNDQGAKDMNPMKRFGRTADMVATTLYLSTAGGSFTNGATLVVDGGQYLHL